MYHIRQGYWVVEHRENLQFSKWNFVAMQSTIILTTAVSKWTQAYSAIERTHVTLGSASFMPPLILSFKIQWYGPKAKNLPPLEIFILLLRRKNKYKSLGPFGLLQLSYLLVSRTKGRQSMMLRRWASWNVTSTIILPTKVHCVLIGRALVTLTLRRLGKGRSRPHDNSGPPLRMRTTLVGIRFPTLES